MLRVDKKDYTYNMAANKEQEPAIANTEAAQATQASVAIDHAFTALELLENLPIATLEGSDLAQDLFENLAEAQRFLDCPEPNDQTTAAQAFFDALKPSLAVDSKHQPVADERKARLMIGSYFKVTNDIINDVIAGNIMQTDLKVDKNIATRYRIAKNVLTHVSAGYRHGNALYVYHKNHLAIRPVVDPSAL